MCTAIFQGIDLQFLEIEQVVCSNRNVRLESVLAAMLAESRLKILSVTKLNLIFHK